MNVQNENTAPSVTDLPGARAVLLAGLGAASLIRRNTAAAVQEAVAVAGRVPKATGIMLEGLGEQGRYYRDRTLTGANALGQRVVAIAGELATGAHDRLQPVLRRLDGVTAVLGIRARSTKATRKPVRKARKPAVKTTARRKTRKAA